MMPTKIGKPITSEEIDGLVKIVAAVLSFFRQKKAGIDPDVETAIQAVEDEVGLTEDVMRAWNWYDERYQSQVGPNYWDEDWSNEDYERALDELRRTGSVEGYSPWWCYTGYATKHFYWWESSHYTKLVEGSLGRIKYHLMKEVERLAEEAGYSIQPWYLKYLPFGLMAGLGTALIIVLARRRR